MVFKWECPCCGDGYVVIGLSRDAIAINIAEHIRDHERSGFLRGVESAQKSCVFNGTESCGMAKGSLVTGYLTENDQVLLHGMHVRWN